MNEIDDIAVSRLKKGAHTEYMNRVKTLVEADPAALAKGGDTFAAFTAALAKEKKEFAVSRKSLKTDELKRADKARDRYFATMRKIVKSSTASPLPDVAKAAREVMVLIDGYNADTRAQLDEESAVLGKITKILRGDMLAEATTLGITPYVEAIGEQNEAVRRAAAERLEERSGKVTGAVKRNRLATDESYRRLVKLLNAYSYIDQVTTGTTDLAPITRKLNAEIKHYKQEALEG